MQYDMKLAQQLEEESRVLSSKFVQQESNDMKLATKLQMKEVQAVSDEVHKFKKIWSV
jgi:hypothetical protein